MARKSAIGMVASQMIPVDPRGGQPPYIRSKHTFATSSELIRFRACIADKLTGSTPGNRREAKAAFSSAAKGCK